MPGKWEDLYDAAYGRIYGAQARFCTECGVMMESTDDWTKVYILDIHLFDYGSPKSVKV
jgi:hypothetical protein